MRKLILALPILAVFLAVALLLSEGGGAFAGSEPVPADSPVAAADLTPAGDAAPDWSETKKAKPKPKKSANRP